MNEEKDQKAKETPKPKWWKPFWIFTIVSNLLTLLFAYIFRRDSFLRILIYFLIFLPFIGLAYYIRINPSKKVNRVIYIFSGAVFSWALVFFGGVFLIWLFNLPPPYKVVGPPLFILFFFIFPPIVGGILGDFIGKRKNYRIPFSLDYNENIEDNLES